MELLTSFLTQIIATVGVIFLFGSLIALLRRSFCAISGRSGPVLLLITGIIGTPIHELSHALMCLLFGHKITEVKLYQPGSDDGTLGYVSHTYNKKNVYHQIGNFFIGTAPVVLGGGIIILLMLLLIPDSFESVMSEIEIYALSDISELTVSDFFGFIWLSVTEIFSGDNFSSWHGWVFVILAILISTHMEMSGADIKSSLVGLLYIAILLFLVDGAFYLLAPEFLAPISEFSISCGLILSAFLSVSLLFLAALLIIALIFRGIGAIFKR